jgi:hypothetical protein
LRQAFFLLLAAVLASSCDIGPSRVPPLASTHASIDALAAAVLQAVARRDAMTLRSLALNEREFRDYVWPELPAARPERNLPFSYVWGDLRQKSEASLQQVLARAGGTSMTLVGVRFGGGATAYPSYVVHRETILRVRTANGPVQEVRVFGSALEKQGAWKVFSYVVDD